MNQPHMNGGIQIDQQPQQPQQQPTHVPMAEVQAVVGELTIQRNMMSDRAANLAVQVRMLQQQVEDLKAQMGLAATVAPAAGDQPIA